MDATLRDSGRRSLRIVVADDSAVIRHMLSMLFDSVAEHADRAETRIELCASVTDGVQCVEAVRAKRPDMVLLDLEMPRMSGMEVLDVLHRERPEMPIIMCSAYTMRGAAETLEALARGAADYVTKPSGSKDPMAAMASLSAQLLPKIAALAGRDRPLPGRAPTHSPMAQPTTRGTARPAARHFDDTSAADIVGIGVSTGGPAALEQLLPRITSAVRVPIVIVQHMPKLFTSMLAERLDRICRIPVREAFHGAELGPGSIWLAPGDSHMEVMRDAQGTLRAALNQRAPVHHCRPAADVLFRSLAKSFRARALGLVLTGMGSDGLEGAQDMVRAGGTVLAQDEASSAVWGMPGRVAEAGIAAAILPLNALADELMRRVRRADMDLMACVGEEAYALQ